MNHQKIIGNYKENGGKIITIKMPQQMDRDLTGRTACVEERRTQQLQIRITHTGTVCLRCARLRAQPSDLRRSCTAVGPRRLHGPGGGDLSPMDSRAQRGILRGHPHGGVVNLIHERGAIIHAVEPLSIMKKFNSFFFPRKYIY